MVSNFPHLIKIHHVIQQYLVLHGEANSYRFFKFEYVHTISKKEFETDYDIPKNKMDY